MRLLKIWGHPWRGLRHFIHRYLWAARVRLNRLENICCFLVTAPMDYACYRPLQRHLPGVRIVADSRSTARFLRSLGVPHTRRPGFPRAIIQACYLKISPAGVRSIQINHGLGLAKPGYYQKPQHKAMDLYIVGSRLAKERFAELGIENAVDAGFPKLDRLFDDSLDRRDLLHRLGLPEDRKAILYAPTWGDLSTAPMVWPYLPELAKDHSVLVKLHDHTPSGLREIYARLPGILVIEEPDCTPYLFLADLLISDISSIVFEYSLLDRPIVLVSPPMDWRSRVTDTSWWGVGVWLDKLEDLAQTVRELILGDRPDVRSFRAELLEKAGIVRDGRSASRAAQAIKDFLEREGIPCKQ